MAEEIKSDYQKALELAEAGCHEQAWSHIQRYLQNNPNDAEALNDAGAILHCLGQSEQAINHLVRANQLRANCQQIIWNLIEAYLAAQRPAEAKSLFYQAEQMKILNPEVLNRAAKQFVDQGNKTAAVEVMQQSLKLWPNQEILEHMIKVLNSVNHSVKKQKIAFFCGGDGRTFLNPVVDFISQRHEVRFFEGTKEEQMYDLMKWSDISWFEWCTNLAALGSRFEKTCKVIIRLHRYEAYTEWPKQVNWQNVDYLITVGNSFVKKALTESVPNIQNHTSIITLSNGVDLEKIRFVNRQRGKNIAFIGNLRMVKNPVLMLQCMQKLNTFDPAYRLFIAGVFQEKTLEQYVRHMAGELGLGNVIFFDGWQSDINSWLADKHYVLCTSIIESQGMGVLEGMAAGLKPVVHNFPGSGEIYLPEFLFNSPEQFCEKVLSNSYDPQSYRRFVEQRYSAREQLEKINELMVSFEDNSNSQRVNNFAHIENSIY